MLLTSRPANPPTNRRYIPEVTTHALSTYIGQLLLLLLMLLMLLERWTKRMKIPSHVTWSMRRLLIERRKNSTEKSMPKSLRRRS